MLINGGKIYGEGQAGIVKDIKYIKGDKNTLFYELNKNKNNKIKIYGIGKKEKILIIPKEKILNIIKKLKKNLVVKKFKKNLWFFNNSNKNNFKNELTGYKEILKIFGEKELNKYTAIKPLFIINNIKIYGISTNKNYYSFSEYCSKSLDEINLTQELYNKFTKDIIKSLKILQKNHYIHNDIKPDNIMYCNNQFKLIDWEMSKLLNKKIIELKYCGNTVFNHPIKYYLAGFPSYICRKLMDVEIFYYTKHNWIGQLKSYNEYKKRSINSFNKIINSKLTKQQIHNKFSKYFDNYAFAINLVYLAEKNKIKPNIKLINKLMKPLEYPIL